jgi:hypothetical protein
MNNLSYYSLLWAATMDPKYLAPAKNQRAASSLIWWIIPGMLFSLPWKILVFILMNTVALTGTAL